MNFEIRNERKYSTSCPNCGDVRKKKNTKTLMVYRDPDGFIRYECMHPGCEWNERQFMKDPNPMTAIEEIKDIEIGHNVEVPHLIDGNAVWWYRDLEDRPMFGCLRKDIDGRKIYLPVRIKEGSFIYASTSWPTNKVLYNQHLIKEHDTIIVVEGEKAADAGTKLFSKAAVVTWRGGASNIAYADWELLKGKNVILWPDNDEPGHAVMSRIGDLLPSVHYKIAKTDHLPPKADLADNLSNEDISIALREATIVDKIGAGRMSFNELEEQHNFLNHRLETGIEIIDQNVSLPMSGVVVIEGRTKHGKSATAIAITNQMLLSGKKVAYFSYEIPASRVVARYARTANPMIPLEDVFKSAEMARLKPLINKSLIVFDQKAQLGIDDLVRVLDDPRWHDSVVVLDYLQIIPLKGSDRQIALKNVMDRLRVLANKHGFIIFALSQLTPNRSNPLADTPREANDIHFSAEAVLRVWYKDHETPHPLYQFTEGNYTIHVLLNRDGEAGQLLGFDLIKGAALIPRGEVVSKLPSKQEREELTAGDVKRMIKALDSLTQALIINKGVI